MKFWVNFLSRQNLFSDFWNFFVYYFVFYFLERAFFTKEKKYIENVIKTGKSNLFGEHFR